MLSCFCLSDEGFVVAMQGLLDVVCAGRCSCFVDEEAMSPCDLSTREHRNP